MHTCFGQRVNRVQIPAIGGAVLRLKGLRRAAGTPGSCRSTQLPPTSMTVEFEVG